MDTPWPGELHSGAEAQLPFVSVPHALLASNGF